MSFPHRVAKVTLSGTMFGGQEIWSTGFYLGHENADADPITPQGAADISAAWETFFSHINSGISNQFTYSMCKVSMLNNDGRTMGDQTVFHSPTSAVIGGAGNQTLPPQISLVATLANSMPRGLATKGRMFLPGVGIDVDNTGHIPAFSIDNISTNLQAFFNSVYNDADLPGNPVLASLGRGVLQTEGAIRNVTQIRIGNVYDTQRRRRNALHEAYTIKPVALG